MLATAVALGAGCASPTVSDRLVPPEESSTTEDQAVATTTEGDTTVPAGQGTTQKPSKPPTQKNPQLQPNAPTTKPKPGPQTLYVNITDSGFSPSVMAVNAGDTVVWVNKSSKNQTSASVGTTLWDSGNIPVGGSYKRVFSAAGSYNYISGSTNSKGTIVVH